MPGKRKTFSPKSSRSPRFRRLADQQNVVKTSNSLYSTITQAA